MLEDASGNLWLSTNRGVSQFRPATRTFVNYSGEDNVGDLTGSRASRGACYRSPAGDMYFGGYSGLIEFNPLDIVDIALRAPIRLTDFKIAGRSVVLRPSSVPAPSNVAGPEVTLSDAQRNFSLEFASLNFLEPNATRYRYRMEPVETQWNEVASDQRVVSYTGLPSGTYAFRAQAAVGRGEWTDPGIDLHIRVLPPWWRSGWFTTLIGALVLLVASLAYAYRLKSIARQYQIRLEARVYERTQIARNLHDTLLQGLQGLILRFQAVAKRIPADEPAREMMERVLVRADAVLLESRSHVQELHASTQVDEDLPAALAAFGEPLAEAHSIGFSVAVEGTVGGLHPILREEVFMIAREALLNACQHSAAHQVEVELAYASSQFRMRIRDDGNGIDPRILAAGGRAGHWGFGNMRERARKIRSQLDIWSSPGAGTEVELRVPATLAYRYSTRADRSRPRGSRWGWLALRFEGREGSVGKQATDAKAKMSDKGQRSGF